MQFTANANVIVTFAEGDFDEALWGPQDVPHWRGHLVKRQPVAVKIVYHLVPGTVRGTWKISYVSASCGSDNILKSGKRGQQHRVDHLDTVQLLTHFQPLLDQAAKMLREQYDIEE